MRRFPAFVLILALVPLVLAACGSSSSSGGVRGSELSYFPANAPFVLSIQTDPNSSAVKDGQALIGRFPIATVGEAALMSKLQQQGINYQSDIRPLFGNPIMVGAAQAASYGSATNNFLAAWVTKDAGKLSALVQKLHLQSSGSHDGATLYSGSLGSTFAVDGATAVLGGSAAQVTAALDRHAHGGGMSDADATRDLAGLPQNTLIQAFGNLTGVLSTPRAANARRVPWVAAIRGYGAAISATNSGLSYRYRLDTSGSSLSASQLPIAGGSSAPSFAGSYPITFGLKNPAQVVNFVESAMQASSPTGYANFLRRQAAVRAKTGVDISALLKLLTGDLIVGSDGHTTVGRAAVSDPATAASDLGKLMSQPRALFSNATSVQNLGGGFYAVKSPKQTITLGVSGNELVVGRAPVAALRAFAAAPTTPAAGAQGSLAFRVGLAELLRLALRKKPVPKAAQAIFQALGVFSGWTAASSSALTGNATLQLS